MFPFLLGIHCLRYFKISPHRLCIETCRYYDAPTHKNERICQDCIGNLVIVEIHFLVQVTNIVNKKRNHLNLYIQN